MGDIDDRLRELLERRRQLPGSVVAERAEEAARHIREALERITGWEQAPPPE